MDCFVSRWDESSRDVENEVQMLGFKLRFAQLFKFLPYFSKKIKLFLQKFHFEGFTGNKFELCQDVEILRLVKKITVPEGNLSPTQIQQLQV